CIRVYRYVTFQNVLTTGHTCVFPFSRFLKVEYFGMKFYLGSIYLLLTEKPVIRSNDHCIYFFGGSLIAPFYFTGLNPVNILVAISSLLHISHQLCSYGVANPIGKLPVFIIGYFSSIHPKTTD